MLSDSSASSSSFVVVPSVVFPILCSHTSRAAPLRRCCLPCGMAFPRRNNKKCPSPPFQETETLKLLPSDSCSPCAKHFLTATNLGLSSIFYRTAPEKSIFFCRTSQFFCRRSHVPRGNTMLYQYNLKRRNIPTTQKRKTAEAVFLFGSELSSN